MGLTWVQHTRDMSFEKSENELSSWIMTECIRPKRITFVGNVESKLLHQFLLCYYKNVSDWDLNWKQNKVIHYVGNFLNRTTSDKAYSILFGTLTQKPQKPHENVWGWTDREKKVFLVYLRESNRRISVNRFRRMADFIIDTVKSRS